MLDTVEVIDESAPTGYAARALPSAVHRLALSDLESMALDVYDTARTAINTIEVRVCTRAHIKSPSVMQGVDTPLDKTSNVRLNDIGATVYKWHRASEAQARVRSRRKTSMTRAHTHRSCTRRAPPSATCRQHTRRCVNVSNARQTCACV
jgi:hypothetical protein